MPQNLFGVQQLTRAVQFQWIMSDCGSVPRPRNQVLKSGLQDEELFRESTAQFLACVWTSTLFT